MNLEERFQLQFGFIQIIKECLTKLSEYITMKTKLHKYVNVVSKTRV